MNFNINTFVHVSDSSLLAIFQHKMYQSRCLAKNSWWWAERLPETCRIVITIKLDFSTSVGLIHKETFCIVCWTGFCYYWIHITIRNQCAFLSFRLRMVLYYLYVRSCVTHLVLLGSEIMMLAEGAEREGKFTLLFGVCYSFLPVNQIRCFERAASKLVHAENRYCSRFLWSKSQICDGNAVTICTNEVMIMSRSLAHSTCS